MSVPPKYSDRSAIIEVDRLSFAVLRKYSGVASGTLTQQYQVNYNYYFDNSAHHRVMGTVINPVSSRVLTYQENRDGTTSNLSETTQYSIPVPTTFDPTKPPPKGGTSTITHPDGSLTQIFSQTECTDTKSGTCSVLLWSTKSRTPMARLPKWAGRPTARRLGRRPGASLIRSCSKQSSRSELKQWVRLSRKM